MIRIVFSEARSLDIYCGLHTCAKRFAGLPHLITAQLLVIYTRDFDADVDAIQQRTKDPFPVFGNNSWRTPTDLLWVIEPSTRTGIHCCNLSN